MRFLKAFLSENTTPKEPSKPTKPILAEQDSTPKEPTKPTELGSVGFDGTGTLVSRGVLRVFTGGKIVAEKRPLFCHHCDPTLLREYEERYDAAPVAELVALIDKRRGNIVEAVWPDGRREWQCHRCGRPVNLAAKQESEGG